MPHDINLGRRRFLSSAAAIAAAARLGTTVRAHAATSFGSLKQVNAGNLDVGYAEAGPADGPAVILLHGWPYDIRIDKVAGCDWGARTANIVAALWPDRCKALVRSAVI